MMQPIETSGAVEKPNSSAPSSAAMATSRPVCSLPSVWTRMRRRRDQADAWNGMPDFGDEIVDLMAGKLAALAGLGALRHLDLQLVGIDQIIGGDAKSGGGDLLDRRPALIAVGIGLEAGFVFPTLAGVGLSSNEVHGDGQGLMLFLADGAER